MDFNAKTQEPFRPAEAGERMTGSMRDANGTVHAIVKGTGRDARPHLVKGDQAVAKGLASYDSSGNLVAVKKEG